MQDSLLIELLTEELPPKSLVKMSEAFSQVIVDDLTRQGFVLPDTKVTSFATPRRLAVLIDKVLDKQADRIAERKGPSMLAGLDANNQPTHALIGFAKSCGVTVDALEKSSDAKGEYFTFRSSKAGEALDQLLAGIADAALKKLPIPKLMRWGDSDTQFVRPVHGLVMLHGSHIVPGEVLGLTSSNQTLGHRFLSNGPITLTHADHYESELQDQGKVIANFDTRRNLIKAEILTLESEQQVWVLPTTERVGGNKMIGAGDDDLLDEVTALVEYPALYCGEFSSEFLNVPEECLTLSMKQHQRYFPMFDQSGKLLSRFLMVSNLPTSTPSHIIQGNERVLRARLSDAKFFYDQDRKIKLEERIPKLADVVYHNKLGSQLARVNRIKTAAGEIAHRLHAERSLAERAALLCKADLLTGMVGEFPELQGVMGQYYARHDGEIRSVRFAVGEHYRPRFAGDTLPLNPISISVALADKLDTLVGIYGIGLIPTGDKDPFGLRRSALGALRILSEMALTLDLVELLQLARDQFAPGIISENTVPELHAFMLERLKNYLRDQDFAPDEIESVVSQNPTRIDLVVPRLRAVQAFRMLPEAEALAAANKRIRNILKQAKNGVADELDAALLIETAEQQLAEQVLLSEQAVIPMLQAEAYTQALQHLAALREPIDRFFDTVMVMSEDEKLRNNRLALLNKMQCLFSGVADLSKLQN